MCTMYVLVDANVCVFLRVWETGCVTGNDLFDVGLWIKGISEASVVDERDTMKHMAQFADEEADTVSKSLVLIRMCVRDAYTCYVSV